MSYVDTNGGCWLWTGALASAGYGRVAFGGRMQQAHRVVYEIHVGPIAGDLELDHQCHNADPTCPGGDQCHHRRCVNPAHLEPVPPRINKLRGRGPSAKNAQAETCPNGHPYTAENTYVWRGGRHCRACRASAQTERRPRPKRVITTTCVMCGVSFTFDRRPGQAPNVCSEACRATRKRQAARDHQRRRRART